MPRLEITNLTRAPQGFYEVPNIAFSVSGESSGPTFIKPGETRTLEISDADLENHRKHPTMFRFGGIEVDQAEVERQEEAERNAPDPLKTFIDGEGRKDAIDLMDEAQLRAFITDRGQTPHHRAGLEKLREMARAPVPTPGAAETPQEEGV